MKFQLGLGKRLPMIQQMEASECGLACVAMIAIYHGHRFTMPHLRQRVAISHRGSSFTTLIDIAALLQLEARGVKAPLEQLNELPMPCILHWDMDHFVVLKKISRDRVVIHDPNIGVRVLSYEQVSQHFTGVALELSPTSEFAPIKARQQIRLSSITGKILGLRRGMIEILSIAVGLEMLAIVMPFQLQWIVDNALVSADRSLIMVLGLGFTLLALLHAGMSALRGWLITRLSAHMNFQWMGNVFRHLLRLPISYFEKRHLGMILTNVDSIREIQHTMTTEFTQAVVDGLLTIGTAVMLIIYSVKLTAIAVIAVLLYAALRWLSFHSLRNARAEELISIAKGQTHFMESVRGVQTVRLFGRTAERAMGFNNLLADRFNAHLRAEAISVFQHAAHTLLLGVERVAVIWLGALLVLDKQFTLGMLFAFLAYKEQFTARLASLIDKLFEWRILNLHAERVADIVHATPERESTPLVLDEAELVPSIELRNIDYRYGPEELVLKDISLSIKAGESVAITGASGSGKTTLVKVMLGLFTPTQGEVLVSGQPLRHIGIKRYRSMLATVMQDDSLFTGSVSDNISFFDPAPDREWLEACARAAAIHDEIIAMPMGYHTLIGDIGTGLSGGQKQRVLLARALYRRPKILVLDEATSHLDVWNEKVVNESIKQMKLTCILVAHRPETIAMAQRVIHLERGRIIREFSSTAMTTLRATE